MTPPPATAPAYWSERASLLIGTLTIELHASPAGTTVARKLRSGYTVSLTVGQDGRRRCQISTEDRPAKGNIAAWNRLHRYVGTMRHHLGISFPRWEEVAPTVAYSGVLKEFHEAVVRADPQEGA